VINARFDNFLSPFIAGAEPETQRKLVPEALERASAYLEAGADCVYPIALWEPDALGRFMSDARGPVNISRVPQVRSVADLAALGRVARELGSLRLPRVDGPLRGPAPLAQGMSVPVRGPSLARF